MKILLLGEFSAFHKYLKEGLLSYPNVSVDLFANGDGWKKISGANRSIPNCAIDSFASRIRLYRDQYRFCNELDKYDVIQLINPFLMAPLLNRYLYYVVRKKAKCLSLVACGGDYRLVQAYLNGSFSYSPYDYYKVPLSEYDTNTRRGRFNIRNELLLERKVDTIIPTAYEYSVGYLGGNLCSAIPLPVNINEVQYSANIVKEKIVFFHGLNKEAAKGTPFIRNAMEKLVKKYPNDVEIIIDGHMPYDKYVSVMRRANVVIDQCLTSTYGINGCIAMAQGKVLMAGNTPEMRKTMGFSDCPVIPIIPDSNQIFTEMEKLIHKRDQIIELGQKSRAFVEKNHSHVLIAKKYLEVWASTGKLEN